MNGTVLITGASSGIGLAAVKLFLKAGYHVTAHYHSALKGLENMESEKLRCLKADFSKPQEVRDMFAEAVSGGHEVGVLVNNAGTYYGCELGKVPEEQFDYVMGVNLKAAFILSQLCLEHMKPYGRGRIINISSIGVKYGGSPSSAVYSMSKAALEAMTMAFAKAGAPRDILVNALRAGVTDTQRHSADKSKDMKRRAGLVPLGRMARPEEIAESILFLASEKSSFTTGSILTAGGGE